MICCDNEDCSIKWFHLRCVGLDTIPDGSWYCPNCKALMDAKNVPYRCLFNKALHRLDSFCCSSIPLWYLAASFWHSSCSLPWYFAQIVGTSLTFMGLYFL